MRLRHVILWLRLLFGLLALTAVGWQLRVHIGLGFSVANFFSYFTNLSNLLAAFVLLFGAAGTLLHREWSFPGDRVRYVSAVNMAIVGIVFAVLLRNVDLGALLPWVNFVLHYLMPCVVVVDWLVQPSVERIRAVQILRTLIFPAVYLGYVCLRGHAVDWYPYPFLDPANVGGYGHVALYSLGIALTFLVVGASLAMAGNFCPPRFSATLRPAATRK